MTLTWDDLNDYLGPGAEESYVQASWNEALAIVNQHVGSASASVPDDLYRKALLIVGSEQYHRRRSQNGFTATRDDGTVVYLSKDPLYNVRALLRPWVLPF